VATYIVQQGPYTTTATTWVSYPVADLFSKLEQAIIDSYHKCDEQRVLWWVEDKYNLIKINYIKNRILVFKKYQKMFIGRHFPIGG